MGLVTSDGYVSDNVIEIVLNNRDRHILETLRNFICPQKPLYEKEKVNAVRFAIHSKVLSAQTKEILSMKSNNKHKEAIIKISFMLVQD